MYIRIGRFDCLQAMSCCKNLDIVGHVGRFCEASYHENVLLLLVKIVRRV
jgi:hypothetical protein